MPQTGELLGSRYRIGSALGGGGMATVYRATDLKLGRDVAVKVLLPNLARDAGLVERFEREARALASVAHPAIVAVYDVDPGDPAAGREPYFVMELCPNGSLADRLAALGRLPPDDVVALARRIADALTALHARGILHRDVKPHNVLMTGDGPKLADFGIAKVTAIGGDDPLTVTGTALGTLAYAAPEILSGEPATSATDTYGLGALVYQALTGQPPRPFDNLAAAVDARLSRPPAPSTIVPSLGPPFDQPLAAALSPQPADRPEPAAFATALESALAESKGQPVAAHRPLVEPTLADAPTVHDLSTDVMPVTPIAQPRRTSTSRERRPWWPIILAAAGVGVVGLAALAIGSLIGGIPPGNRPTLPASPPMAQVISSPSPAASALPQVTPAPTPEQPGGGGGRVRAALRALRDIAGGLDDEVSRDLVARVDEVERSLSQDGAEKAAEKARDLRGRVRELVREGKVAGGDARRLENAAEALVDALAQ